MTPIRSAGATTVRRVAMTGAARTASGITLTRPDMLRLCREAGLIVYKRDVKRECDLLVASRDDSSKARQARNLKVPVIDYPAFFAMLKARGATVPDAWLARSAANDGPLFHHNLENAA